jgi:hypothetical protein
MRHGRKEKGTMTGRRNLRKKLAKKERYACRMEERHAWERNIRVRVSALPDFLRSSGSGTGSTQPRENN